MLAATSVVEVDQGDQEKPNSEEVVEHGQEIPFPEIVEELKQGDPNAYASGNEAPGG